MICQNPLGLFLHALALVIQLSLTLENIVERASPDKSYSKVYWNSTNSLFVRPNNIITVNILDTVEIICPLYSTKNNNSFNMEFYIVYMVSKDEFDRCLVFDTSRVKSILVCNRPNTVTTNKIIIFDFSPMPSLPDFKPGCDYYFISTSTGSYKGLRNQVEGACRRYNMKLILRISGNNTKGDCDEPKATGFPASRPKSTAPPTTVRHHSPKINTMYEKPPADQTSKFRHKPITRIYKQTRVYRRRDRRPGPGLVRPISGSNTGVINGANRNCLPSSAHFTSILLTCMTSILLTRVMTTSQTSICR